MVSDTATSSTKRKCCPSIDEPHSLYSGQSSYYSLYSNTSEGFDVITQSLKWRNISFPARVPKQLYVFVFKERRIVDALQRSRFVKLKTVFILLSWTECIESIFYTITMHVRRGHSYTRFYWSTNNSPDFLLVKPCRLIFYWSNNHGMIFYWSNHHSPDFLLVKPCRLIFYWSKHHGPEICFARFFDFGLRCQPEILY